MVLTLSMLRARNCVSPRLRAWALAHSAVAARSGGFAKLDDIEALAQNGVETFVPVRKPRNADRDRHVPQPSDPPGVADWRTRMGGDDAKTIYTRSGSTPEEVIFDGPASVFRPSARPGKKGGCDPASR
jgi:hypothetical protein